MSTLKERLDLVVALVGDIPLRDDREAMSAPLVSLSKKPPARLEWTGPSGQKVIISASDEKQIATIYDFDIIIWAISQINAAIERGKENPGPTITFKAKDLLKTIQRGTSGKDYIALKDSLNRLRVTRIQTSVRRRDKERHEDFNLLVAVTIDEDDAGRPLGMRLTLPPWIYDAILTRSEVLAISPLYFQLTSGLDRFLYRLARRHAGNGLDNPDGWAFSFKDLHSRTGSPAPLNQFTRDLRKAIARQALPTYEMVEELGVNGNPMLRLRFRKTLL